MPTLADTALVPGAPAGRTKVTIAIAGTSDPVYLTADPGVVIAPRTFYTEDDGTFEVTLVANDDLTPAGTAYTVTFDGTVSATIDMPAGGGPYALIDVLAPAPDAIPSAGAAQNPLTGTAAGLASTNPVLALGRFGYASDSDVIKIGDGVTAWNDLDPRMPALPETISARGTPTASGITATVVDIAGTTISEEATDTVHWRLELLTPFVFPVGTSGQFANPRTSITDAANAPTAFGFGQTGFVTTANQPQQCAVVPAVEYITDPGEWERKGRIERMFGNATLGQGLTGFESLDSILIASPFTP